MSSANALQIYIFTKLLKPKPYFFLLPLQPEPKESGHTPEMTGPHCTKEIPVGKNPENKKPQLRKTRSQDLPDKHHPEHQKVLQETRLHTQEAYSKTSKVETIMCKSNIERREEMHTSISHSHTINVSHSPVERDKRSHTMLQTKRSSQETPPPPPPRDPALSRPIIIDIQRELQGTEKQHPVQKTNSEDKYQACRNHPFHLYSKVSLVWLWQKSHSMEMVHFPILKRWLIDRIIYLGK